MNANLPDYQRVGLAIEYLERNWRRRPSLRDVADSVGLSEFHFQRLFTRWAGITPKRFIQALTLAAARKALVDGASVLDTSLDLGLSGPGRLHDLFVTIDAVTPGEFKTCGEGLVIEHGFHRTPFGRSLVGVTDRGLCWLSFGDETRDASVDELAATWPRARLRQSNAATAPFAERIFAAVHSPSRSPLRVLVRGTNFQVKVWQALLRIPPGRFVAYEDIARAIGRPLACRAVGQAVGINPVAFLIPCHRVLRKGGAIGGYGGGLTRKRAMLAWETARLPEDEVDQAAGELDDTATEPLFGGVRKSLAARSGALGRA